MSFDPGTRLGPYEVLSKLGDGGMGVVYRGIDTRLGREVAIKMLPAATAASTEAQARLEREARAIATLNHPNICTLFDVGAEEGRPYLVMELLAGATLHQVLAAGPLPIPTLIDHATALADALHAAHARAIIHRDLKPANVFVTEQGLVKMLDFGLAKADREPHDETRTVEAALTGPGTTLGTLAYMSPEQLRGEAVDVRTDLFSLGLVLYEMATGRRAFAGKTSAEVSAAILHQEPADPASLRTELPQKLNDIILKALEKDKELRYQSAAELRGDLKRLKRQTDDRSPGPSTAPRTAVLPPSPPPSGSDAALAVGLMRRHPLAIICLGLALVAAAAATWWVVARDGAAPAARSPELSMQQLTLDGRAGHATISPDGRFIAYVRRDGVQWSVVVKQLTSNSDVVILGPSTGTVYGAPSVTPDGGFVDVLESAAGSPIPSIVRVPFLGGPPRRIVDNAGSGIGWSPDGQRMAFVTRPGPATGSLVVADAQGQNARVLATRQAPAFFTTVDFGDRPPSRPSWSADGRWIALAGRNVSSERTRDPGEMIEIDAATGAERSVRRIDENIGELAYLDNDNLVVSLSRGRSEPGQWRLYPRAGSAAVLFQNLSAVQGVQLTADRATAVAVQSTVRQAIAVGPVGGPYSEVVAETGAQPDFPVLDARGNLFYTAQVPGGPATFRSDGKGGGALVAAELAVAVPSPDATFVIGLRRKVGLVRVKTDGSGAALILQEPVSFPRAFTPDGSGLVYISNKSGSQQPWLLPLAGGEARRLSDVFVAAAQLWLSRDGREVIFGTARGTRVCAFPAFDQCREVKVFSGPLSADGKTVFAVDPSDRRNILAQPLDGSQPTPLTHFTDKEIGFFSLSPDGTRIAITRTTRISDVVLIKGLK